MRTSTNTPVADAVLNFSVDGVVIGSASTDSNGKASLPYTVDERFGAGKHKLVVAFAGDKNHSATTKTATFKVVAAQTQVAVTDATASRGATISLQGSIARVTDGAPLAGRMVRFQIDGNTVGSTATDAMGMATLSYAVNESLSLGSHKIRVLFDGEPLYSKSSGTGTLKVK